MCVYPMEYARRNISHVTLFTCIKSRCSVEIANTLRYRQHVLFQTFVAVDGEKMLSALSGMVFERISASMQRASLDGEWRAYMAIIRAIVVYHCHMLLIHIISAFKSDIIVINSGEMSHIGIMRVYACFISVSVISRQ